MSSNPFSRVALAGVALVTAFAVPAGAQDARPEPTSCAGLSFTDPAGDHDLGTLAANNGAPPSGQKPPDNHDVTGGFFRYAPDASGTNVLTANIVVANLDKRVQTGALGVQWLMRWTFGDATYSAVANYTLATDTLTGSAGSTATAAPRVPADVKLFEGKDGIVQITIPVKDPALGGMDGKSISATHAWAKVVFQGAAPNVDEAPDAENGKAFKTVPCATGSTPTPGTNAPGAAPTPAPGTGSDPGSQPSGPGSAPSGPATLDLKVIAGKPKAKAVSKKKALVVGLEAGEPISDLTAKLLKGKKTVGTGSLASLSGKGRLRLKVARKIKKGTYTLTLAGRKADGRTASTSVQLRIR